MDLVVVRIRLDGGFFGGPGISHQSAETHCHGSRSCSLESSAYTVFAPQPPQLGQLTHTNPRLVWVDNHPGGQTVGSHSSEASMMLLPQLPAQNSSMTDGRVLLILASVIE
jgi:hypothetical protein